VTRTLWQRAGQRILLLPTLWGKHGAGNNVRGKREMRSERERGGGAVQATDGRVAHRNSALVRHFLIVANFNATRGVNNPLLLGELLAPCSIDHERIARLSDLGGGNKEPRHVLELFHHAAVFNRVQLVRVEPAFLSA
jgi:hypothetical protein